MMKDKSIEQHLDGFHDILTSQHIGVKEYRFDDLVNKFRLLVQHISKDYDTYRSYIPSLLSILEKNDSTSIAILGESFFDFFDNLNSIPTFKKVDKSIINADYTPDIIDVLFKAIGNTESKDNRIRISDFSLNKEGLSNSSKLKIISSIVDFIEEKSKLLTWDEELIQLTLTQLAVIRDLLNDQGDNYWFYFLLGSVFDRLSSSEYYQQSRDLAEEILIAAYKDEVPHLGYLILFRCYSNTSSSIAALMYANFCLFTSLTHAHNLHNKFIKEIIWQAMKFFRNISLFKLAQRIYISIPDNLDWDAYEKRSIEHTYLLTLLKETDDSLPSKFLDFLNRERETILKSGIKDALPLLISLYNIRRIYPEADFSSTGLGFYENIFEMIVPAETVERHKVIIEGESKKSKVLLRESLVKLNETRNRTDIVNDNEIAISIANRMIESSVQEEDFSALLLAMLVKADYSIIFLEKKGLELAPMHIPHTDIETFEKIYGSESHVIKNLSSIDNVSIIWLITSEKKLFQLNLFKQVFSCHRNNNWSFETFQDLRRSDFFSKFQFNDTIKTKSGEVRIVLPEEHLEESEEQKKKINFAILETDESIKPILFVLDIEIAGFPHNLFIDSKGEFIYIERPICNILSTEWYLKFANKSYLEKNYSKSIWIPTEGGDFTINQLFGSIEDVLSEFNFNIENSMKLKKPITSDLNIVTAHGSNDIALKQVFYPDGVPRLNLDSYLGIGKVLIFFVCHSGSTKSTPFKNSISTIIKEYITKGYLSVIAPFWSLHINIPPIWLSEFLQSIDNGNDISKSVHNANMAVSQKFPTLSAWACMHLYGDPHLKLKE
ncbi:hypothetical protein [uncultured Draconibacterium sp.]|uniref:hypothetical protein n=1 Tax=uncultured Draconibacterium sp. TaxID=1573823 RepID=UPI00261CE807|nr:hypothetical protein [uncultured Draconibacterium sp.]